MSVESGLDGKGALQWVISREIPRMLRRNLRSRFPEKWKRSYRELFQRCLIKRRLQWKEPIISTKRFASKYSTRREWQARIAETRSGSRGNNRSGKTCHRTQETF